MGEFNQPLNRSPFDGGSGIAFGSKHHRHRTLRMHTKFNSIERIGRRSTQQGVDIGVQQRQGDLAFRVPKPNVEFNDERIPILVDHETDEQHAAVGGWLPCKMTMHGLNNTLNNALMDRLGNHGGRTIGAHATGVGTLVAIVGSLVILARRQGPVGCAVHHDKHAGLLSGEEGFEEDKTVRFNGRTNEGSGNIAVFGHDDALATSKHVSLDHPREPSKRIQGAVNIRRAVQSLIGCSRNTSRFHGLFCMQFGPFKVGQSGDWTETRNPFSLTSIGQSFTQRCFRTNHDQINL